MKRNRQAIVVSLVAILGLVACEADPDVEQAESQPGQVEEATGTPAVADGQIQLAPIDHSGVTGTVVADRGDDEVSITATLEGLEPGVSYSAHVHDGRCAAGGPVRIPMGDLERGEEGTGTFRLTTGASTLPAGAEVFVQVHGADGAAVACADLSQGNSPSGIEPDTSGA
jgi:hypothetical protein